MIDCELKIDGKKRIMKRCFPEVLDLHSTMDGVTTTVSRNDYDFNVRVKEIHFNGFSFVNQRYTANADVELHVSSMLENPVMTMGYVRSGNVWNEYELTENDVALTIQPHEDDTRLKFKKGSRVDVFNILLSPGYVRNVCERNPEVLERFVTNLDSDVPMSDPTFPGNKRLLRSLNSIGDYFMLGNYADKYLESKVLECITEYLYQKEGIEERPVKYNFVLRDKIHDARQVLLGKIKNPLSLHELAAEVGTNECTLKRAFKEEYHMSVFQYLYECRMNRAVSYLLDSQLSISEIATLLGFDYQSHFCTAFKRKFKMSPSQFREKSGRNL